MVGIMLILKSSFIRTVVKLMMKPVGLSIFKLLKGLIEVLISVHPWLE